MNKLKKLFYLLGWSFALASSITCLFITVYILVAARLVLVESSRAILGLEIGIGICSITYLFCVLKKTWREINA